MLDLAEHHLNRVHLMGVRGVINRSDLVLDEGNLSQVGMVTTEVVHEEGEGLPPHLGRKLIEVRRELYFVDRLGVDLNVNQSL